MEHTEEPVQPEGEAHHGSEEGDLKDLTHGTFEEYASERKGMGSLHLSDESHSDGEHDAYQKQVVSV